MGSNNLCKKLLPYIKIFSYSLLIVFKLGTFSSICVNNSNSKWLDGTQNTMTNECGPFSRMGQMWGVDCGEGLPGHLFDNLHNLRKKSLSYIKIFCYSLLIVFKLSQRMVDVFGSSTRRRGKQGPVGLPGKNAFNFIEPGTPTKFVCV